MAVTQVQSITSVGSGTSTNLVLPSATSAGNLIFVYYQGWVSQSSSISDTLGNGYTALYTNVVLGSNYMTLWYAPNISAGSNTITVVTTASGWNQSFIAVEYSGAATSSPIDANNSGTGNSTAISVSATAIASTDLLLLFAGGAGSYTFTVGTGFSNLVQQNNSNSSLFLENKTLSASGSQAATATMSSSASWLGFAVAVKDASGVAAPTTPRTLASMGLGR